MSKTHRIFFLFAADPSEAYPLSGASNTSVGDGTAPLDPESVSNQNEIATVIAILVAA
eukprot:SAG31_NODE_11508_length_1022_cov_1.815818_3_plen_57_part_01